MIKYKKCGEEHASWRSDAVTTKQKRLIAEMNEFSEFSLPPFNGKTKGEASDYISTYLSKSHESFNQYEDSYGNQD